MDDITFDDLPYIELNPDECENVVLGLMTSHVNIYIV